MTRSAPKSDPPDDQQYRYTRIEYEDGTTRDHESPWPTDQQLAKLTPAERISQKTARAQALWFAVKNLFEGATPGMPKALGVIAQWAGHKGTEPQ